MSGMGFRGRRVAVAVLAFALVPALLQASPVLAAPLFTDGFETGTLAAWSTTTGFAAANDPSTAFAGSWYGMATSTGAPAYAQETLGAAAADLYVQSAVRVASTAGTMTLLRLVRSASGTGPLVSLKISKAGVLMIRNHVSALTVKSATKLATGTWYTLQLHGRVGGASSLIEVWLNGSQVTDLTSTASLGTSPIGAFMLGTKGSSSGFTVGFDEVVADLSFIGGPPPTPTPPQNLHTTAVGSSTVDLAWDPVTGMDGYGVYRDGVFLQDVTGTTFSDTGLAPETTYTYAVDSFLGTTRSAPSTPLDVTTTGQGATQTVVRAAGDIACDPTDPDFNGGDGTATRCRMKYTAQQLAGADQVLALGDTQYACGGTAAYAASYDPTWGQYKSITHAIPADAEYTTTGGTDCAPDAAGFYAYFGASGGAGSDGIYSFNLPLGCTPGDPGCWHVVGLNSVCKAVGGCAHGSPQDTWLQQDLGANAAATCTLAMLHVPRFASKKSGINSVNDKYLALWETMYAGGADLVLSGNSHFYERFAPQDPLGNADPKGIVEFIVGTGGRSHGGLADPGLRLPNSQAGDSQDFGVLHLVLRDGGYDFQFLPEGQSTFTDSGSGSCH